MRKDAKAIDRIMSDDFLMLSQISPGDLINKKAFIENALSRLELLTFNFENVKVQLHGDTAVFHCKYNFQANYNGHQWGGVALVTDTWVRQGESWKVLSRHSSNPPPVR